jgi:hypothetical protein
MGEFNYLQCPFQGQMCDFGVNVWLKQVNRPIKKKYYAEKPHERDVKNVIHLSFLFEKFEC